MKLKEFIKELEKISMGVSNPDKIDVEMADCIPAVKPILKENVVFITDIDPEISECICTDKNTDTIYGL